MKNRLFNRYLIFSKLWCLSDQILNLYSGFIKVKSKDKLAEILVFKDFSSEFYDIWLCFF